MTTPYQQLLDDNEELAKKIFIILNNLRLRLHEKSTKQIKKETEKAFYKIEQAVFAVFLRNAKAYKQDVTEDEVKKWLNEYYIVTQYVYYNELKRKEQRYVETLITIKDNDYSYNGIEAMTAQKRLAKGLKKQFEEYGVMIVDKAIIADLKAQGVTELKWVTQKDRNVCAECIKRNGKIYKINKVPPKPHYGCRCYMVKVGNNGR